MSAGLVVWVATEQESNEGGFVLGVFSSGELARAHCVGDAEKRGRPIAEWFISGAQEWTNGDGGTYWQVERCVIDTLVESP